MRKAYILIYDDNVGTRDEIKAVINDMPSIKTWRYDMPNCFYLISEKSAGEIYEEFITLNGTKGKFAFLEINENRQGQMLKETWYLMRHKKHKPKEE